MPFYRVTGEEGTPIDPTLASYSGEQNLFLDMPSMAFPAFKSLQPSSNTIVSPSLRRLAPQTRLSPLPFFSSALPPLLQPNTPQKKALTFVLSSLLFTATVLEVAAASLNRGHS